MMSGDPNPREDLPGVLLPALADYEDEEDRPDGDMDTAETGDIMGETGDQMEFETGNCKTRDYSKEGSFSGRQQLNSSEESLTLKARDFIAKTRKQNLGAEGGGRLTTVRKKTFTRTLLPPPLQCQKKNVWTTKKTRKNWIFHRNSSQ
jgi:hypothetical protein